MNYTQGKWTIEDKTQIVVGDRLVANTGGYSNGEPNTKKENEANARLIVLAPDMHKALQTIYDLANGYTDIPKDIVRLVVSPILDRARGDI
jgi:hypothetical protein